MSTPEELRDRIIADTNALYDLGAFPPPDPSDPFDWMPTLPASPENTYTLTDPVTYFLRDYETPALFKLANRTPSIRRISGLAHDGSRQTCFDSTFRQLVITNHNGAFDEVAFDRAHIKSCDLNPDHYALYGGPFTDVRISDTNLKQVHGRESTVRIYNALRTVFVGCYIKKQPGSTYTKSPIRIHDSPSVRLNTCAIDGGSAIHVGAATEHLVNGRDPNPCGSFEMDGCTFKFLGLYPHDPGPSLRFTGCRNIRLHSVNITGPYSDGHTIYIHPLIDGSPVLFHMTTCTYNGNPLTINDVHCDGEIIYT